jgi:TetR/AcrR family transcriptional regulator
VDAGEVRADIDVVRTMRFLWGASNGVIALAVRRDRLRIDAEELRSILRAGRALVRAGMRASPGSR